MERDLVTAQQAAIQEVRARYERGQIGYDDFRRALDAVVLAQHPDDCQAILQALPSNPLLSLAALETAPPIAAAGQPPIEGGHTWLVGFMSEVKKVRRRWQMRPQTHAVAVMGEVKLDLRQAQVPPRAYLEVAAVMGEVTVYVPRSMRVRVRSTVLLGEANALGESTGGVITFGHEEYEPEGSLPTAELEIRAFVLMGSVQVRLADEGAVTVSEAVREALRMVTNGIARGFVQGMEPRTALSGGDERGLPPPRLAD